MSRSLFTTFGFHQILEPVNRQLESRGLSFTLQNIIKKCSPKFEINLPPKTKKALGHQPTILISNHPAQAEVLLLLAAIPPRPNVFFIVMHDLLRILPAIDKHLIPVYITHRFDSRQNLGWGHRLFRQIHPAPKYLPEVAHQKNIANIALAARKIDHGSLVGIFPAGGSENGHDFLPGVGHLIKNLKNPQKVNLVMAHVSGTSHWDFFRIIPFLGKLFPTFRITFSTPLCASDFLADTGRLTATRLQLIYDRWSSPFIPLPKFQTAASYLRSFLPFFFFRS